MKPHRLSFRILNGFGFFWKDSVSAVWEWKVIILKTLLLGICFQVTDIIVAIFKTTVAYLENFFTRCFIGVCTTLILFF